MVDVSKFLYSDPLDLLRSIWDRWHIDNGRPFEDTESATRDAWVSGLSLRSDDGPPNPTVYVVKSSHGRAWFEDDGDALMHVASLFGDVIDYHCGDISDGGPVTMCWSSDGDREARRPCAVVCAVEDACNNLHDYVGA